MALQYCHYPTLEAGPQLVLGGHHAPLAMMLTPQLALTSQGRSYMILSLLHFQPACIPTPCFLQHGYVEAWMSNTIKQIITTRLASF